MKSKKLETFTEFHIRYMEELMSERIGELYGELEKLYDFRCLSEEEDFSYDIVIKGISTEEHNNTFKAYCDTVDKKYVLCRRFFYMQGFKDNHKQHLYVDKLKNEEVEAIIKPHWDTLNMDEEFKQLTSEEEKLSESFQASLQDSLPIAFSHYIKVVQKKFAQYSHFYYVMGVKDCADYLTKPFALLGA